jgi:acetyl-CoA acyltransferase
MSKQVQEAYIVAATRTPIGRSHKGYFRNTRPDDLLAAVLRSALAQAPGLDPKAIEDVICGCAIPEAQQGLNVARIGAILAGLPNTVGGITVNRFCASGLSAVQMAADRIRVGEAEVMIAAGVESMSMVPMMGNSPSLSPAIFANTDDVENYGIAYGMGLTAEKVAQQWKVSRDAQDAFAVESHRRAVAAMKAGEFTAEITPMDVTERSVNLESGRGQPRATRTVNLDEGARPDTTLEGLAKLRAVFAARGSVTAGNSSQTSDGAGALILASEAAVKRFGLKPLARFVSYASRGVPPHIMGIGPIAAIPGRPGLRRTEAGRHRLVRAQRSVRRPVAGRDEHPWVWTPPRSIPWAARLHWGTRSGPPALSAPRLWCTPCSGTINATAWSRCVWAWGRAPPASSSASDAPPGADRAV